MKANNIFRILSIVFVLCTLLVLTTLAADSYKVINFEDSGITNTLSVSASGGSNTTASGAVSTITDQQSGMKISSATISKEDDASCFRYDYNLNEAVNLNTYRYVKIKFRTNYAETIQVYLSENTGHYITELNRLSGYNDGAWKEVGFYLPSGEAGECTSDGTNEMFWSKTANSAAWPSAENVVNMNNMFIMLRYMSNTGDTDRYFDIEYIAFFEDYQTMQSYNGLDAKIIRFDGTSDITATVKNGKTGAKVVDGVLRADAVTKDGYYYINFSESIVPADYPYMVLKYNTNDSAAFKSGDFSQLYLDSTASGGETVYQNLGYPTLPEGVSGAAEHKYIFSLAEAPISGVTNGFANSYIPKDKMAQIAGIRMAPRKNIADGITYPDAHFDIEYIAFFKTLAEAQAYGNPSNVIFSSKSSAIGTITGASVSGVATATESYTTDGTYRLDGMKPAGIGTAAYSPRFEFHPPHSTYNLKEYPYLKLKLKTNWPNTIQFYVSTYKSGVRAYHYAAPGNAGGADQVFKFNVNTMATTGGPAVHPNATLDTLTLSGTAPFFQFKGANDADTNSYYAEIAYFAYFTTEAERDAFGAAETKAVNDAATALTGYTFKFTAHPANPVTNLKAAIKEYVEETYANVYADVTVNETNTSATVVLDNIYADSEKVVTIAVEVTTLSDFTFENLGATIRVDDVDTEKYTTSAMRFGTKLVYDAEDYATVTYGAVASNTEAPVLGGANVQYHEAANKAVEEDGIYFNTVITNIPKAQLATKITVRPYITYTVDGDIFTWYGEAITRSVDDILASLEG